MSHDTPDSAADARKGLLDGITGKAKEVAGAVTGRDDLVEEGQLQQAQADHRKQAVADEAVADAKRRDAADQLHSASLEAAAEKEAAHDKADVAQRAVDHQRAEDEKVAEQAAAAQEAAGRRSAEQRADVVAENRIEQARELDADATSTAAQAAHDAARLGREADAAELEAARLRADAHRTDDGDHA